MYSIVTVSQRDIDSRGHTDITLLNLLHQTSKILLSPAAIEADKCFVLSNVFLLQAIEIYYFVWISPQKKGLHRTDSAECARNIKLPFSCLSHGL